MPASKCFNELSSKSNLKSERGQAMVEFAIVLPLLMVLVLGIIQFGITFKNYISLVDAVRAGARTAAVSRQEPAPGSKALAQITDAGGKDVQIDSTWAPGSEVTVSASYPFEINLLGLVVASGDLHSTTKERVE
jgi:hypothetical protein